MGLEYGVLLVEEAPIEEGVSVVLCVWTVKGVLGGVMVFASVWIDVVVWITMSSESRS